MPTDDERREVARRLRELRPGACFDDVYEALGAYGPSLYESRGLSATGLAGRLADLIEPSCDREALLRLADKVFEDTEDDMRAPGKSVPAFIAGQCLRDVARRIREALGVVS